MTDRSLVKKPRPVVFSLAELERYPTLQDRYAITLPFDDLYNRCRCPKSSYHPVCKLCERGVGYSVLEANCIKRTGERWAVSTFYEPYIFAFHQPSQSLWSLMIGSCGSNKTPLTVTNGKVVLRSTRSRRRMRRTTRHSWLSSLGDPSRDYESPHTPRR